MLLSLSKAKNRLKSANFLSGKIVILLILGTSFTLASPPDTIDHFPVYRVKAGAPTFYEAIQQSLLYPNQALRKGIIGTAIVTFILNPKGEISDLTIVNSLGKDIDREILEAFRKTKYIWLPDSLETNDYILYFPVNFIIDGHSFMQAKHEAGFMQNEIRVVGYGNSGKIREDKSIAEKAMKFYQKENYKWAINYIDELIRRNPFNPELYKMRAYCRYKLDDLPGACEDYHKIQTLLHQSISPAAKALCQTSK